MAITTMANPPPGETYDFDYSHRHLYTANMAVISAGLIISTSCLVLRVYTKAHLLHKFGWDDGMLAVSMMSVSV